MAVVALALVGGTASRASSSISPSDYASQYMSLYNQVVQIVSSDKSDCVKMAKDLSAWQASHKATIAELNSAGPKLSKTALVSVALRIESQLVSDAQKIAQGVVACVTNAKVAAALAAQSKLAKP